jgi:hypothetical protein
MKNLKSLITRLPAVGRDLKKRLHRFFTYFQRVSNLCSRGCNMCNQESV